MPIDPCFGRWRLVESRTAETTAGRAHVRAFRPTIWMHCGVLVLAWTITTTLPTGATSFFFTCPSSDSAFFGPDGWAVRLGKQEFLSIDRRSNSAMCIYDNDVSVTRSLGAQPCVLGANGGELADGKEVGLPRSGKVCIFKPGRPNLPQECYVLCP